MDTRRAFGVQEAADYCSVSYTVIHEAVKAGNIPAKALGRKRLIERADLDAWLDALPDYQPPVAS